MARSKKQINVEIGQRIRRLRDQAGLSREAFSERIGISPRFCASLEVGLSGISLETLKRICEFFGVSADVILWGNRDMAGASTQLEALLAGVEPALQVNIVESIRSQVDMLEKAKKIHEGKGH